LRTSREQFLIVATLFQGGLAIFAFSLAWFLGINPFDTIQFTGRAVMMGMAGTIPMLIVFALTYHRPVGPFKAIKQFLVETLGPHLSQCRWYDLVWVALLAGCSEELLFRAVLQTWLNHWGPATGLLGSNAVFGMAHAVTPMYAVVAGLLGIYLGVLYEPLGGGNLFVPTLTHALYDLVAFAVVRRSFLEQHRVDGPFGEVPSTTDN
jgi:membrane protease YdiL (CAAX protease family)